jgi:PKD repeat protein
MEGIYEVGLLVKIGGKTALDLVKITVRNYYPEARAVHDPIACEDEAKTFNASTSTDQNGAIDIASYHWQFGDGSTSGLKTASHSFAKEGAYVVTLTVTDKEGAKGTNLTKITVQNKIPVANAGADRVVDEDDVVNFDASGSSDTSSDISSLTYHWDFGDGATGNGIQASHVFAKKGAYVVQLKVTDNDGEYGIDTAVVNVGNVVPTSNAGPDQTVREGQTVLFEGRGTADTPTDRSILDHSWTFGINGSNPTYVWLDDGIKSVSLTATDDDNASDVDAMSVNVQNVAPSVGINALAVADSTKVNLTLRSAGEKWRDVHLYLFEDNVLIRTLAVYRTPGNPDDQSDTVNDVLFEFGKAYNASVFFTPDDDPINGQPTGASPAWIILGLEDGRDFWIHHTFNVNEPETYRWDLDFSSIVKLTPRAAAFDPGSDSETLNWDFGDVQSPIVSHCYLNNGQYPMYVNDSAVHVYVWPGTYAITLTAVDDDGGSTSHAVQLINEPASVSIDNCAPIAAAGSNRIAYEDDTITLSGSATDDSADVLSYLWDFGDNSSAVGRNATHKYCCSGSYLVILTATDNHGAIDQDALFVTIQNVVPDAKAGNDQTINEDGAAYFYGGQSVDTPSDKPLLTYRWGFGDGTFGNGISASHIYTKAGTYTVTLIVTDNDGARDTDTLTVSVNNVAPTANAGPSQSANEDQVVFFAGTVTDTPTDRQTLSYSWTFGDGGIGYGKNPTHSYVNAGTYSVALVVTDNNGATATSSMQVTISNVVPVLSISGYPATAKRVWAEALHYQFDASAIDTYSDRNLLTYDWDLGDGNAASTRNPSHMYAASGTYVVYLTVLDNEGASVTSNLTINVILDSDGDILRDEDEIGVYHTDPFKYDTDGDWLTDYTEVTDVVDSQGRHTDPTKADSDCDGLNDWEERYDGEDRFITDPFNPDTDGDGLIDSQEMFTKVFRTTDRFKITDCASSSAGMTDVSLSGVYIAVPYNYLVYKVDVKIGLTHDNISNLGINLIGAGQDVGLRSWNSVAVGDTKLYTNYDLLDCTEFSKSMFNQKHAWTLRIWDFKADGSNGFIEYFEIHLTGRTYPRLSDYDGDGVNDYEEISPGNDGWTTEPYVGDTDGDGWGDGTETKVKFTDPTRADTDRDGVIDSQDIDPLHNLFLKITIQTLAKLDNQIDHDVFVGVTYNSKSFFTPHKYAANSGDWYVTFNNVYTIDAPDRLNQRLVPIIFSAYQLRDTWNPLDYDHEFNLVGGSAMEYSMSYDLTGSTHNFMTSTNYNSDANDITQKWNASLTLNIVTTYADRINTILLNSTEGQSLYLANNDGIHTAWRYTGENKFYVAILNVDSSATGAFVPGYNALLIPRKVFLDSDLNHTLRAANNIPAHIGQLGFGLYDDSQSITTGSIVATLTGPKGTAVYTTGAQANDILNRLLVNVGGQRIIAQYRIVTTQLVTLNLDDDVLKVVPYKNVRFDGTGAGPTNFWGSLINFVVGIGTIIVNGLVAIGDFLGDLWNAISSWGMKILSAIASFLSDVINALVKAVTALIDFIGWIISFAGNLVSSAVNNMIQSIANAFNDYAMKLGNHLFSLFSKHAAGAAIDANDGSTFANLFMGSLLWVVVGLSTAIVIIFTIIGAIPLINLIALVIAGVIGLAIFQAFSSSSAFQPSDQSPISGSSTALTNEIADSASSYISEGASSHISSSTQQVDCAELIEAVAMIVAAGGLVFDILLALVRQAWIGMIFSLAILIIMLEVVANAPTLFASGSVSDRQKIALLDVVAMAFGVYSLTFGLIEGGIAGGLGGTCITLISIGIFGATATLGWASILTVLPPGGW